MKERYYLHGDKIDCNTTQKVTPIITNGTPLSETYYCVFCDFFASKDHFDGNCIKGNWIWKRGRKMQITHEERFKESLKRHNKAELKLKRPENAPNLFK